MPNSQVAKLIKGFRLQNRNIGIVAGILIVVLILISQIRPKTDKTQKSYLGQSGKPRGVRNNNPGNIRYSSTNPWFGKVPITQNTDGSFEQFVEWRYGVLALIKLLTKYIVRYGTIDKMIRVYAPSIENNTAAYIRAVSSETGFPSNQALTVTKDTLQKLTLAIAKHEVGADWVTVEDFQNAYLLI